MRERGPREDGGRDCSDAALSPGPCLRGARGGDPARGPQEQGPANTSSSDVWASELCENRSPFLEPGASLARKQRVPMAGLFALCSSRLLWTFRVLPPDSYAHRTGRPGRSCPRQARSILDLSYVYCSGFTCLVLSGSGLYSV